MLITGKFIRSVFIFTPWEHWVVIGILSLALTVFHLIRKRHSVYGAICLGLTVFFGLFLLDTAVAIRWNDGVTHQTGFDFAAEYHRLIHGDAVRWTVMLANIAVFVPFGFFLAEFLSTMPRLAPYRRLELVVLCAFGLSLCIESLQLILRLGVCEVTDLMLNTFGGFLGGGVDVVARSVVVTRLGCGNNMDKSGLF